MNTRLTYDALGRPTNVQYGTGTNFGFAYDLNGRVTKTADWVSTNSFDLDVLGRVTQRTASVTAPGFTNVRFRFAYAYDANGNTTSRVLTGLSGITNVVAERYAYDAMDRLVSVSNSWAWASYAFSTGRLAAKTYGNGDVTRWTYDAESRIETLATTGAAGIVQGWNYDYDAMGMITNIASLASSDNWAYDYDALYRLVAADQNGTNRSQWSYDDAGNRLCETTPTATNCLAYNEDNELLFRANNATGTTVAAVDVTGQVAPGPRSNKWYRSVALVTNAGIAEVGQTSGAFTVKSVPLTVGTNLIVVRVQDVSGNVATQAVTVIKPAISNGMETFQYDLNGNLTLRQASDATWRYRWDAADRLLAVEKDGQTVLENWYDGQGRRIAKRAVEDGVTNAVQYVWDGWELVAVLGHDGHLLEYYTRGPGIAGDIGSIVACTHADQTNEIRYSHCNHRGDVTAVRTAAGATITTLQYSAWGAALQPGQKATRFTFSSKEGDIAATIFYFGYRYYIPNYSRWASIDPAGEEENVNLYTYAHQSPIIYIDPNGDAPFGLVEYLKGLFGDLAKYREDKEREKRERADREKNKGIRSLAITNTHGRDQWAMMEAALGKGLDLPCEVGKAGMDGSALSIIGPNMLPAEVVKSTVRDYMLDKAGVPSPGDIGKLSIDNAFRGGEKPRAASPTNRFDYLPRIKSDMD